MPDTDNMPVALNDDEVIHDIISQELDADNQELLRSEEEIESNIETLRQIQQGTYDPETGGEAVTIEQRESTRKKKGIFGRIKSYFSFKKTGTENPAETGRQRADNHYQDYLIAKAAFDKQAYDLYQQSADGISITANDMASTEDESVPKGKNNIVYGDILRLVGADAKFVHSVLRGKDNVTYSSSMAQLKMLGEYRTLNTSDKVTLFKDFSTDTEKLEAITSAEFDIDGGRTRVNTGDFLIRNGNGRPALYFTNGNISLASEKFRLDLTRITTSPEGITAGSIHLRLKDPFDDKGTDFDIDKPMTLGYNTGITVPAGQDKTGPIIMKNKDNKLSIGKVSTVSLGDLEYLGITFVNARKTSVDDLGADGEFADKDAFEADSAIIRGAEFISISNIKASRTEDTAVINSADISIACGAKIESITANFREFVLSKKQLPDFGKLIITASGITFDDLVRIAEAKLTLSKDSESGMSAIARVKDANINAAAERGLAVSAENVNGTVSINSTDSSLDISSDAAGVDCFGLFSVNANGLAYSKGKFTADSVTAAADNIIDAKGLLTLNGVSVTANSLAIDKSGLSGSEINGEIAQFSMFDLPEAKVSFNVTNNGFSAGVKLESDTPLINNSIFRLLLKGTLNVTGREGDFGVSFEDASLGLSIKDKNSINVGSFSAANGVFSFSRMSGNFDITDVMSAKLKEGSGTVTGSSANISAALEKLVFGSDSLTLNNITLNVTDKRADFSSSSVNVPRLFTLNDFKGTVTPSGVEGVNTKLVTDKPELKLELSVKDAGISGDGLDFKEINAGIGPISIGDFLSAQGASLSIKKSDGGYALAAGFTDLKTALSIGDLNVTATTAEGSISYSKTGSSVNFSGGEIDASFRKTFGVKLSGLSYSNSALRAQTVRGSEITTDLFGGFVSLTKAKLTAKSLTIDKSGIKYDKDGGVTLSAESVSLFGTKFRQPNLSWTSEGFSGGVTFDGERMGINNVFSLAPNGKLGIENTKQGTHLVTDDLSLDFKLFNALTLAMNNITAQNGVLASKAIEGNVSLPADINIAFSGTNLKVNDSGPSIEQFSAVLPATHFLNNLVTVSGSMTAENSFADITTVGTFDINTDFLTAKGSAETGFSKGKASYTHTFKNLQADDISSKYVTVSGLALKNGGKNSLSISANSIGIKDFPAAITGIQGDISSEGIHVKTAKIHFDKIADFNPVDTTVTELCVDNGGVSFQQIKVTQEKGFTLGDILSASAGELIFSKEKNKSLCISASVTDMQLDMPTIGAFALSANGISGTVSYADGALSASLTSGELSAGFSDLFTLKLSGLSYKDNVFGAASVTAALRELSLMGDIVSVRDMNVAAKELRLDKTGISAGGGGLNGTIASIKMFSAELSNSVFNVAGNTFKASTELNTGFNIGSFFSIAASGKLAVTKDAAQPKKSGGDKPEEDAANKPKVDLSAFSGKVMVFSAGFEVSGVSSQDDGMLIGEMNGDITLGEHFNANLSGSNILVGKDSLASSSPIVGKASAFDILGGAVHFDESVLNITDNLTKYDFSSSFTLSAGSITGGGSFAAHLEKGKAVPEITLSNVKASAGDSSIFTGLSLTYGEQGVGFTAESINMGEHVSLSKLCGSVAQGAFVVDTAKISVTGQGKELVNVGIQNARIGDSGFTFDEISTSADDIDLGGFLTIKSTSLKLKNTKDKGFIAELMINNLGAKQELGGFFIKAGSVSGSVIYEGSKISATTTSGSLDAGYLDIAAFSLYDIDYTDGVLTGSVATRENGVTAGIFGDIITLTNAKLSAEKLSLGAEGVKIAEGGKVKFTADSIGVLGKEVANPTLEITPSGFVGSAELKKLSVSPVSGTTLTIDGKVGLVKKDGQSITPITDNLSVDASLFGNLVTLNARQLSLGDGALRAAAVNGTINAGGTTVTMNAGNVSIDKSGPKAEQFTASIENSSLMGEALRIHNAAVSARNNFSDINAKGSIGLTFGDFSSGNIKMDVDFSRSRNFRPGFNDFKLSMGIPGASITDLSVTKQEEGGYAVSVKEISVPALSGAKITNVSGTFSENGLSINAKSHFFMEKFADMDNDINKDLPAFSINKDGLCFSEINLGAKAVTIGSLLSSNVSLTLSREAGKGINITADISEFNINTSLGGFSVSGNTITGSIRYAEGKLNTTINGGDITAKINDLLQFSLNGISYSEEKGLVAASAEMLTKDFNLAGGMVKGTGLTLKGQNLSVSAAGIDASDGISGSIEKFSLLKAALEKVDFTIKPNMFSASADFSAPKSFLELGAFSAQAKGKIGISHENGSFSAKFNNFSAYLEGLGANLSLINVNSADDGITVEKIKGGIAFGDKVSAVLETEAPSTFKPIGTVIGDTGGTVSTVSFFSNALVFSGSTIKAKNNLSDFYVAGTVGVDSSIMQTTGDYSIDILSKNSHIPHISEVIFKDTNIKNVVSVSTLRLKDSSTAADFDIANLKIGDKITVSKADGSFGNSALSINSADFSLTVPTSNVFNGKVENASINKNGLTFDNVTAAAQNITIGDILTVSGAKISITGSGGEYTSTIALDKLAAELKNDDFTLKTGGVSGSFTISTGNTPTSASIESGTITAKYRELLSFIVNRITYKDSTLSIGSITAQASQPISVAEGLAGVTSPAMDIKNMEFDAKGFRFGENGTAKITAENFFLFSKPVVSNVELTLNPNGFYGSFILGADNKPVMLGDDASISAQLSGKAGITKADSITATTDNFGMELSLLDRAVVLSADNISANAAGFTAPTLSGSVKYAGNNALSVKAQNFVMDKNGPSFKTLSAKTNDASMFGGALTVKGMTFTATDNFSSFSIAGAIGIDTSFLKTTVSDAKISFSADAGYIPSIDKLNVQLFELGGLKIENLGLINEGEEGLSISADFIGIPALNNSKITDFSGTFTKSALTLNSGKFSMDGFAGLDPVNGVAIPKFTIANGVLTFDEIKLGKKDVTIADILSIKQTDFSIKKTPDDLFIYAAANGVDIAANPNNAFSITANGLSASVTAKNNNIDAVLKKQGSITAELKNVLKLTFTDPSYENGLLSVGKAQLNTTDIGIAGVARLKELVATATDFGMNKDGFVTQGSSSLNLAGKLSLLEKPFCGFSVDINNSGFKGGFTAADTKLTIADIINLGFSGGINVFYSGEKGADISFDSFSASVNIADAVKASATGISKGEGVLSADSLSGEITALGKNIAQVNAKNISIGSSVSYSSLDATFQPVSLFNDIITIGNDDKTITSTDISAINAGIRTAIKAGPVDFSAKTKLLFSKDKGYKPTLLGIEDFDLTLGALKITKFSLSGDGESGAMAFSGNELTIGNSFFKATNISGTLSKEEFKLTKATAQLNGIFDSALTHEINNLSISKEGLFFDEVTFGQKAISLGGMLTAGAASISIENPKGGSFRASASAEDVAVSCSCGSFALNGENLTLKGGYSKGDPNFRVGGKIVLSYGDKTKLNAEDLSFANGTLCAGTLGFETNYITLLGELVRIDGLSIAAKDFGLKQTGLSVKSINVSSAGGLSILGKKALSSFDFDLMQDGFRIDTVLSKEKTAVDFNPLPVKAALSGHLKMQISKTVQTASFDEIGAQVTIFNKYSVGAENIRITEKNELAADEFTGSIKLDQLSGADFTAHAENPVLSPAGFDFSSFTSSLSGKHSFLNGLMSVSNPTLKITKTNGSLSDITVSGGVGFESGFADGSVEGSLIFKKDNGFKPGIQELKNAKLKIPALGAGITVESITQTDKELVLNKVSIGKTETNNSSDSPFDALMNKIPSISATLPKITYSFQQKKFIYSLSDMTLDSKDYEVDIVPNLLKGTFNPATGKVGITYTLAAPESMKTGNELPKLLGVSVGVPLVPGVYAGGSLYGGAGILLNSTGAVTVARDKEKTNFLMELTATIDKAIAGIGVDAYIKFGVPGFNASLGLRGQLLCQSVPSATKLAAAIGLNYSRAKGFSIDETKTSLSFALKANLVAKLEAFLHAKLFAFIDKDLLSFTIAEKTLAGIDFAANAGFKDGKWAYDADVTFISPESPNDIFFKQKLVDWEKQTNVKLDEAKKLFKSASDFITMRGLGYNETMLQSAVLIRDIIPQLKTLKNMHIDSMKMLKKADSSYESKVKKLQKNIEKNYNLFQNHMESMQIETDPKLRMAFKKMAEDSGVLAADPNSQLKKLSLDIDDPASKLFYMSPVQILTFLSHIYHFTGSGKADKLASVMEIYNKAVNEVEWLYNHPVTEGSDNATAEDIEKIIANQATGANAREVLKQILSEQKSSSDKGLSEIAKQAKEAEKDLVTVSDEIDKLMALNKKLDSVEAKLETIRAEEIRLQEEEKAAAEENGQFSESQVIRVSEKMKANVKQKITLMLERDAILRERNDQQQAYDNARRNTRISNITNVTNLLSAGNQQFQGDRDKLKRARKASYIHRYVLDDQKRTFDLFKILNGGGDPNARYYKKIGEKNKAKAVDFAQFRKFVIDTMKPVATETKSMVTKFLSGNELRTDAKAGFVRGSKSHQMDKILFSNEIYARAGAAQRLMKVFGGDLDKDFQFGKDDEKAPSKDVASAKKDFLKRYSNETSEDDGVTMGMLLGTIAYDREQTINPINELDEKLNQLEEVIITTNETYNKAYMTLVDLVTMDMSSLDNTIEEKAIKPNPELTKSFNTLVTSDDAIKSDLNPTRINELVRQTNELNSSLK